MFCHSCVYELNRLCIQTPVLYPDTFAQLHNWTAGHASEQLIMQLVGHLRNRCPVMQPAKLHNCAEQAMNSH